MKQQTAVEWLINQMPDGVRQYLDDYKDVLTKAIEMDREQKESSWNAGHDSLSSLIWRKGGKTFEEYYEETYEK